ncbi:hypothetical protein PR246_00310 [Metamycoplasma hyosynoviae]|uniref:MHO_1580 family protein n=2 Tax=Metamycoplasma hyosynoviae TaxID=29559 RepID=UPI0023582F46|nr:hypothetical protein [Metamycoplasma hyosynoviae]MDC8918143.1 hypothetical protein [Metamycoplasma hyosynoviae]MDC8963047.1 hypothetical protein [Metamycoplasma hyosynoviae]
MIDINEIQQVHRLTQLNEMNEEVNFQVDKKVFNRDFINPNENFQLHIRRIIQTNEMILDFIYENSDSRILDSEIKSTINNKEVKFKYAGKVDGRYHFQAILPEQSGFKNFTFSDLRNVFVSLGIYRQAKKKPEYVNLYTLNFKIQKLPMKKTLKIEKAGVNIKTISRLKMKLYNAEPEAQSLSENSDIEYLNMELKPLEISQTKYNEKLYKINLYKQWKENKYKTLKIDQTDYLGINFAWDKTNKLFPEKVELGVQGDNNITDVIINSYSYYDKKTKEVMLSSESSEAKRGLVLPLNFAGTFTHNIDLSIGKAIENIKLTYNEVFEKPILNYANGKVNLKIIENEEYPEKIKQQWNTIKYKNIKEIIEKAQTLNELIELGVK